MEQEQVTISQSRTAHDQLLKCLKQADWLGSVGQVFKNTFTYIVDDTLKLSDQSCSRTAKNQLFSLSHTLFSNQLYKGVFRTVFENRFQEFSDWQAPHEEFRSVQGTALKQL